MQKDTWLPEGYEKPKTVSNYARLEDGANKFRVMSNPLLFYEYWTEANKPVRLVEMPDDMPDDIRPDTKIKGAWAFVVWSYSVSKIQILEITQASIQGPITDLVTSDDWGPPQDYDLTITKKGQKLETEYSVQPSPHKEAPEEATKAYKALDIDLEALLRGGDPFKGNQ